MGNEKKVTGKENMTPKEIKIILIALAGAIEDLEASLKNTALNFTPQARKDMTDMLATAMSAKTKLEAAAMKGDEFIVTPYQEGDEKDFLQRNHKSV